MKKELGWWAVFFAVAIILVGQLTEFEFNYIDIQLYDTYYVIPSWLGLVVVLAILGLIRGLIKIIDRLMHKTIKK